MSHRLLILNPGSTSTKAAVYDGEHQTAMKSIVHTNQDLAPYPSLYDQLDYRVALVRGWLALPAELPGVRPRLQPGRADGTGVCPASGDPRLHL